MIGWIGFPSEKRAADAADLYESTFENGSYVVDYQDAVRGPGFVPRAVEQALASLGALATSERWLGVRRLLRRHWGPAAELPLPRVEALVCYALGDLGAPDVGYQLALLLLLANELEIPPADRLVYDPMHSATDWEVLRLCGCGVPPAASLLRSAHRPVAACRMTLFYMPFAPFVLTDDLVRANWRSLHNVAVIGNDLRWVADPEWDTPGDGSWKGRAPASERAAVGAHQVRLWEGDHVTWLTRGQGEGGEDSGKSSLDTTLSVFPSSAALRRWRPSLANGAPGVDRLLRAPRAWPRDPPARPARARM
jgi:hypothetical protein